MTDYTPEDAIRDGQETALENDQASGDAEVRERNENRFEETMDEARESARLNREAEESQQSESDSNELTNDTSKAAKVATAKSQLDPTGKDPISQKEVADSATDADMTTGNKTAVSNEEAARRAANPGEAEENGQFSTANADNDGGEPADEDAAHPEDAKPARSRSRKSS